MTNWQLSSPPWTPWEALEGSVFLFAAQCKGVLSWVGWGQAGGDLRCPQARQLITQERPYGNRDGSAGRCCNIILRIHLLSIIVPLILTSGGFGLCLV